MNYSKYILPALLFWGTLSFSQEPGMDATEHVFEPTETNEDKFQEFFFEALKQKGIENYDLALNALDNAERVAGSPEELSVVRFEKAKNYANLKEFSQAEELYLQVLSTQGERLDVLEHLYDVYYKQQNFEKALPIVKRLIPYHDDYKEDLVNLYIQTARYDEALELLNELESIWGENEVRNALKARIYKITGNTSLAIEDIERKIDDNPKNEKEYLNLIFLYSEQGDKEKAFSTAQELLKMVPESKLVHLALYKYYTERNQIAEALNSMKIVFSTSEIDDSTMLKVLQDFIFFVDKHPEYQNELEQVVGAYGDKNPKVFEMLGDYYSSRNQKAIALTYYEKGAERGVANFELIKNTLLLQLDHKKFAEASKLSSKALAVFPAQALLYLLNGVAHIGLLEYDQAIESLEMGIDFVPEDPHMERDFYRQLSIAYRATNQVKKAEMYEQRAKKIELPD